MRINLLPPKPPLFPLFQAMKDSKTSKIALEFAAIKPTKTVIDEWNIQVSNVP